MVDKKLKNYLKMNEEARRDYLDLITGIKILEDHCKDSKKRLMKLNLPSYEDVANHNKAYGSDNSKYLN